MRADNKERGRLSLLTRLTSRMRSFSTAALVTQAMIMVVLIGMVKTRQAAGA